MEEAERRWSSLVNSLSGQFCASLNFVDETKTIRPVLSFEPEGTHADAEMAGLHLLHGTLPHEVVCTENLTPFLKLLPCKGKAGISSLLDGHKLFDASWQTMAVDVRPIRELDGESALEIQQTVDMVLDIERSMRPRGEHVTTATIQTNRAKYHQTIQYRAHRRSKTYAATKASPTTPATPATRWPKQVKWRGASARSSAGPSEAPARCLRKPQTRISPCASRMSAL